MSNVQEFAEDSFQAEVLESSEPVLVDFYADWCAPCRAQGPIVDQIAKEYSGRAKVGKVDVDAHPALAREYGVQSIPTLVVFNNGAVVQQLVGTQSKTVLSSKLDEQIAA